jgi:hypothetical protein
VDSACSEVMTHHAVTVRAAVAAENPNELNISAAVGGALRVDISSLAVVESQPNELVRKVGADWVMRAIDGNVSVTGSVGAMARSLAETATGSISGVNFVTAMTEQAERSSS